MPHPIDGKGNKELIKHLSKVTGLAKNKINRVNGETGRQKWIAFAGIEHTDLIQRLVRTTHEQR